jgi:PHP family Zn ribbon phosphoesterase
MLAICDHNSAQNASAVIHAAEELDLVVLPGMEICTKEEIHVLGIFGEVDQALELQAMVHGQLHGKNAPDVFGMQVLANECDEVVGFEERLLLGASAFTVEEVVRHIHRLGGVAIASHVDRGSYSVISQLGFIPSSISFDALELTGHIRDDEARVRFALASDTSLVRNSDAHRLEEIGTNTSEYLLEERTLEEIRRALRHQDGRTICLS